MRITAEGRNDSGYRSRAASAVRLEREAGAKSAGLRTHTLVGVAPQTTGSDGERLAAVTLRLAGRGDLHALAAEIAELDGVGSAGTGREEPFDDDA